MRVGLLNNWVANVTMWLSSSAERLTAVPRHQLSILERMGVPINSPSEGSEGVDLSSAGLSIDALIGHSLSGPPTGATATLIQTVNAHDAPV